MDATPDVGASVTATEPPDHALRPATGRAEIEAALRGRLFEELDLLAFAFEMEADEALAAGDEAAAERAQQTRLGIRLAQRLVGAVSAPEVDRRLARWREEYRARFPG